MSPRERLIIPVVGLATITAIGTAGYVWVEGMSLIDALFMTVITMSTVGYGEVQPLGPAGKLFSVGLIVSSVGTTLYFIGMLVETLLVVRIPELFGGNRMLRRIEQLRDHVIVCGFGRFGRFVVEALEHSGAALVVVDRDAECEPALVALDVPYLIGGAAEAGVLDQAGIERARAVVAVTGSDAENVLITLAARERNASVRIHARAESEPARRGLEQAGAEQVVSAYSVGGARMASAILRPAVVDFLEISSPSAGPEVDLEELRLGLGSALLGRSIRAIEQQAPRVRIVAVKREGAAIQLVPEEDSEVLAGDHLVVIGERSSLARLAGLAAGS